MYVLELDSIRNMLKKGYYIKFKDLTYAQILKSGKNIMDIIYLPDTTKKTVEIEEMPGILMYKEDFIGFKKLKSIYLEKDGLVISFKDMKGKENVICEVNGTWEI